MLQGNNRELYEHCQATSRSYYFSCDRIHYSAILNWCTVEDLQKIHCLEEKPSRYPFLSPLFLPLVRFREEQNFRNPKMCSISNFVIKHWGANHSWWPSSKAARKFSGIEGQEVFERQIEWSADVLLCQKAVAKWWFAKNDEKDLISLPETLKDTREWQWVMNLLLYRLRSGTFL